MEVTWGATSWWESCRESMMISIGMGIGIGSKTCQNNQPELIDILDLGPEVSEVILGLLGVESLVLDILVALL